MIALTRILGIALCSLILCGSFAPGALPRDQVPLKTIVVKKGDTLERLAKRHGVKVDDLRRWNRGKVGKGDSIYAGAELVVRPGVAATKAKTGDTAKKPTRAPLAPPPGTWEDHMVVRRGDSLGKIAHRANVDLEALMQWNGIGPRARIKAGDRIRIFRPGPRPTPQSVGLTTAGSMKYGQHLGTGPGYRLRFPKNAYGVDGVLKTLKACAKRVKDTLPGSHDILVGDISRPGGGRFPPHASHQSGRDADVGYYLASMQQNATMHRVRPHEIDYARTWALLRCYLTTDKVVRVYIDRPIQTAMVSWLREKRAADDRQIGRLFQVEGGNDALILHAPKHDTHMHVRFACDAGQDDCVEDDKDSVFKW